MVKLDLVQTQAILAWILDFGKQSKRTSLRTAAALQPVHATLWVHALALLKVLHQHFTCETEKVNKFLSPLLKENVNLEHLFNSSECIK